MKPKLGSIRRIVSVVAVAGALLVGSTTAFAQPAGSSSEQQDCAAKGGTYYVSDDGYTRTCHYPCWKYDAYTRTAYKGNCRKVYSGT
jgi:hypothetical protein